MLILPSPRFISKGVIIAACLVHFTCGSAALMASNITSESILLPEGATVASVVDGGTLSFVPLCSLLSVSQPPDSGPTISHLQRQSAKISPRPKRTCYLSSCRNIRAPLIAFQRHWDRLLWQRIVLRLMRPTLFAVARTMCDRRNEKSSKKTLRTCFRETLFARPQALRLLPLF